MKDIVLVHHLHDAKRAGLHTDFRIIVDGKAPSWATKKDIPFNAGKKIILWEQPVHSVEYAESETMENPPGYGEGTTKTTYRQHGQMKSTEGQHHLYMDDGQQFFMKKMPTHYGDKAWLLVNVTPKEKPMEKKAIVLELYKCPVTGKQHWIKPGQSHEGLVSTGVKTHRPLNKKAVFIELIKLAAERKQKKIKKEKPKKKRVNLNEYPEIGYIQAIENQKGKLRLQRRYLPGITKDVLTARAQTKLKEKVEQHKAKTKKKKSNR